MFWVLVWFAIVIATGLVAQRKNRSGGGWGLLALVLGFIPLIILLTLEPLPPPDSRVCPHCAERIKNAAKVCMHCGRDVPPAEGYGPLPIQKVTAGHSLEM